MRIILIFSVFFFLSLVIQGCDLLAAKYVDATEDAGVREIISTSGKTKVNLLMMGVDSYPSKKKVVYYVLVPAPGFVGPEVLSSSVLPRGTSIQITGAQRCVNCSPNRVRLSLKADGIVAEEPVYMDAEWIGFIE
ncbi:hypothetical protein [Stenotrophomonas sp.]|uniref:hypothetical protein n=1 Tax=Stenotrophomonas sp. TaxID=69392 RepID=UPI0028B0829D|nr:hypothetical protein [Stenotrophomonas sp.]